MTIDDYVTVSYDEEGNPLGTTLVYAPPDADPITIVADSEEAAREELAAELERLAA